MCWRNCRAKVKAAGRLAPALFALLAAGQAGADWQLLNHEVNDGNALLDVSVATERTACAVGAYKSPSSQNSRPRIMCTSDGGRSWSKGGLPGAFEFPTAVFMVDDQIGFLCSFGISNFKVQVKIYRSENGGRSWNEVALLDGAQDQLYALFFLDAQTGWAAGSGIFYTQDGGQSWHQASVPALGDRVVNGIHFMDAYTGIAVGGVPSTDADPSPPHDGFIMRSTDGGATWQMVQEGLSQALARVDFADSLNGWAVGGGTAGIILHTTDGGQSWAEQQVPSGQYGAADYVTSVAATDQNHAWAVGNIGEGNPMVLFTTDGGASWQVDADYPHAFDGLSGFDAFAKYSMVLDVDFCEAGWGLVVGKNMIIVGYTGAGFCPDFDGDGHRDASCGGDDCDDGNKYVSPSAEELCNGLDENCDGVPDDGFDLMTDPKNCGSCGFNCQPAQVCWNGECTTDCPAGLENCGGECADLRTNPLHCGSCGTECLYDNAEGSCSGGICTMGDCAEGYHDIDGDDSNGCEYACTPTGPEVCDGVDNDCNGIADDGLDDCTAADGGSPDGGAPDGGSGVDGGYLEGEQPQGGCGCSSAAGADGLLLGLL
ncbi:MAG: hypothetical protein D6806_03130, partial [Deltaproteobacteria bacterium]